MNRYFSYLFGTAESPFPREVKIELTNVCNRKCWYCPHSVMKRKQGFMSFELFKKIISQTSKAETVSLHFMGESTLHPEFDRFIEFAKENTKARLILSTNCYDLDKRSLEMLDLIVLNVYSMDDMEKVKKFKSESKVKNIFIQSVGGLIVGVDFDRPITNWGSWMGKEITNETHCYDIYNKMVVCWNGIVVPCCIDYEGNFPMGNCELGTLEQIWNSERFKMFRRNHRKGMELCKYCRTNAKITAFLLGDFKNQLKYYNM